MSLLLSESTIGIREAAAYLDVGRDAVRSWMRVGTAEGIRLEYVVVGNLWKTSHEACDRFAAACTARQQQASGDGERVRTDAQARRSHEQARKELDRMFAGRRARRKQRQPAS